MVQPNNFFSLEQVVDSQPLTVTADTHLSEVIRQMQEWGNSCSFNDNETDAPLGSNNSCVLVVENSQLRGIFTERDLVKLIANETNTENVTVGEVMTQNVVALTITDFHDLFTALKILFEHRIRHLPVVDNENNLLGLITAKNLRQKLQPINLMKWRTVSEIMETKVIHAPPHVSIRHIAKLMANHLVSCVAIAETEINPETNDSLVRPMGIITERDIVQFQNLNLALEQPARNLMSTPLFLVSTEDTLWNVHQQMKQRRVRRLLVGGKRGELQGIITQTSLLQVFDPTEMYGVIEMLQQQVCQLETEKTELLENRQAELERLVQERTAALEASAQQLQLEINKRQQSEQRYDSLADSLENTEILLEASEQRFRAIFDRVFQFIGLMKPDGTLLEANQTALDFGGLTLAEVANKPFWEARWWTISKETQEHLKKALARAARGEFIRYEVDVLGDGERVATIDFSIKPIKERTGRVVMLIPEGRDITEQKQLEKQFLRTQRLESLGTLAGGIAHDLNNILAPILGFSQLLPLKLPDVDEGTKEYFNIMKTNAQRGSALVKQILTFSRGLEGERGIVQIRHLIDEIGQIITETFPKSIELEISAPKTLWTVNADVNQLHQVLMNLAVNARDAMPDGGKLVIQAVNFTVDADYARLHLDATEGSYLLITVSDTGVGIAPEIIERIFEPFFTTKEMGKGTGLGLSTVIGIVKSHGGFVDVESDIRRETQGTQVKVFLPASETAASETAEPEEILDGDRELILVVDDETSILNVTRATLETYNYRVLTASNGIEAIATYVNNVNEIALVIIDIMMPNMDGITAIRTLRQIAPEVKIIAVSGLITSQETIAKMEGNVAAFIAKPYTNEELLRTIHEIITVN